MSLIKGGPHPNAAKVFINWFLSRKGQMALQKYEDLKSMRTCMVRTRPTRGASISRKMRSRRAAG